MASIELDYVPTDNDDPIVDAINWAKTLDANVTVSLVEAHGPAGGGLPIVGFTGDPVELVKILKSYYQDGNPDELITALTEMIADLSLGGSIPALSTQSSSTRKANEMTEQYTVELDVMYDIEQTVDEVIEELVAKIEYTVLDPHGPGGGAAVVRFTGSKAALDAMLLRYVGGDHKQLNDLLQDGVVPERI